jgi:hypothetical protein
MDDDFGGKLKLTDKFNVFPNPFTAMTNIELSFANDERLSVEIWSVDGKLVKTVYNGSVTANTPYVYSIDGSTMMPGIYFVKVIGNDRVEYKKIELLR